jgi:glycerophosphoryl diester phosphodiesterase family protein
VVGEVVAEVWRLFRKRFWRTLLIVALLLAPLELAVALFDPDFSSVAPSWWWWVAISSAVTFLVFPWVIGALVHDIGVGDEKATDAYRDTAGRLPALIISAVVSTIGIVLGTIALVIPGLLLMARWALIVPLIVLEGATWRESLSRSNELVRGRTWSVVGIFVVLTLIMLAIAIPPLVIASFWLDNVFGAWLSTMILDTVCIAFYAYAPFVLHRRFTG